MQVKVPACDCFNCGNIIGDYWITESAHIVECRNGLNTERRQFKPHDKCWCPRWTEHKEQ